MDSLSPQIYIVVLIAVVLLVRFFIVKQRKAYEAQVERERSFLVPEQGGVLQNQRKDEDGNIKLRLGKKIKISHDTYIFRFSFTDPYHNFGLPIGQHVIFSAHMPSKENPAGEIVERKYTPTTSVQNNGYVDFVIKIYRKNVHPRFPDGGLMTQYLETLDQGQEMLMKGPFGRLAYQGFGKFLINKQIIQKKRIGMVAGGTGITPCYQVLQAALNGDDGTHLSLIFGNRTVEDILLKEEIDQFKSNYAERFNLFYTVDVKPEDPNWSYGVGFVTEDMLKSRMPEPSPDTIILYCGPPPFEDMMKKHLGNLGYSDNMVFKF